MESVNKLEQTVAAWYKDVPHLPKDITKWLADNAWWIVLIGIALTVVGMVTILPAILVGIGLSSAFLPYAPSFITTIAGIAWFSTWVSLAGSVATAAIEAFAVSPLKTKQKKGWSLLFVAGLVSVVVGLFTSVITANVFGVIGALLGAAIWGYVLFEVREYFEHKKVSAHKPVAAKKPAATE